MLAKSVIPNNPEDYFDWQNMDYIYTSTTVENETMELSQNDSGIQEIVPLSLTSAIFFSTPPKSSRSNISNSTDTSGDFQFYVIGIYGFFAVVFGFGIILMLFKKLQKACCISPKTDINDYESVSCGDCPQDNLAFENQVHVSYLDVDERNAEHDSDYEYYSDTSNGGKDISSKDRPPAYEDPPAYSILLQK